MSSKKRLPPGPRGFRELCGVISQRRKDPLAFYTSLTRRYGDVVYLKVGSLANVFVTHPDAVQRVLQTNAKNYVKGPGYERLRSFLGKGLLTSEGELWRRQRKLAAPAFHHRQLATTCQDVVNVGREMLERWETQRKQGRSELDLAAEMSAVTLSVVGRTLFSSDSGGRSEDVRLALQEVLRFSDAGATAWLRIVDLLIPTQEQNLGFKLERRLPLPRVRAFHHSIDVLRRIVTEIIENRRKSGDYGNDLLGALMRARDEEDGTQMTTPQLRDEVVSLINAGHETTATALSWTWLMLERHPELAARVRSEISEVLGDRDPEFQDLERLAHTRRFFEETIRLYPPFWRISRRALQEDELLGYRIPAGSVVVVSPYLSHRDPRFWPEPERFDPDRFLPESSADRHRFSYLPFGGGARICLGAGFAYMEALSLIAMILRRYDFRLGHGYRLESEATITLKPRHGVPVSFSPASAERKSGP